MLRLGLLGRAASARAAERRAKNLQRADKPPSTSPETEEAKPTIADRPQIDGSRYCTMPLRRLSKLSALSLRLFGHRCLLRPHRLLLRSFVRLLRRNGCFRLRKTIPSMLPERADPTRSLLFFGFRRAHAVECASKPGVRHDPAKSAAVAVVVGRTIDSATSKSWMNRVFLAFAHVLRCKTLGSGHRRGSRLSVFNGPFAPSTLPMRHVVKALAAASCRTRLA